MSGLHLPDSVLESGVFAFDNSAVEAICKCPRNAWHLLTLKRRRARVDEALSFGRIIHAALELRYREAGGKAVTVELQSAQEDLLERSFAGVVLPSDEWRDLGRAKELIQRYNQEFGDEAWSVVDTERSFEFELGSVTLTDGRVVDLRYQGRIDLTVRFEGRLYPVDFKTLSYLDEQREIDKYTVSAQMLGYCESLAHTHGQAGAGALMRLLVGRKPSDRATKIPRIEFKSRFFGYSAEQRSDWRRDIQAIVQGWLNSCLAASDAGAPPMHRSSCAWPRRCQFWESCTCADEASRRAWLASGEFEHNDWSPMTRRVDADASE